MMHLDGVKTIANAILYEGYMLYPYRPSALKNQRPGWSFGTLLPPAYVDANGGDSAFMEGQVLITGAYEADLAVEVRFLQLNEAAGGAAIERSISLETRVGDLVRGPLESSFSFLSSGDQAEDRMIAGSVELAAQASGDSAAKISIRVQNHSKLPDSAASRDAALKQSLIAAHAVLGTSTGEFISLLDPPEALRGEAASCRQTGVFPVLAGDRARHDVMLVSPIILYDYPEIAPESPGNFYDSAEIDELLTLRVLTLTDSEKNEMCTADVGRDLLERTQSSTPEDVLRMHGAIRRPMPGKDQA
jgi:hypothetical protein